MQVKASHVIFDLDGTLIDSAPSILASMQNAFREVGVRPIRPLTSDLIGPPLAVVMRSLLTHENHSKLPALIECYVRHYDSAGYRGSQVYDGVPAMLKELRQMGLSLYIATNKRILPSRKILEYFGWTTLFDGLYALDYFRPTLLNKKEMLQHICRQLPSTLNDCIYVGDRTEDGDAAKLNDLHFVWASWGYGAIELEASDYVRIADPSELAKIIKTLA